MDAGTDAGSVDAGHVIDSGANAGIDAGTGDSGTNLDGTPEPMVSASSSSSSTPLEEAPRRPPKQLGELEWHDRRGQPPASFRAAPAAPERLEQRLGDG